MHLKSLVLYSTIMMLLPPPATVVQGTSETKVFYARYLQAVQLQEKRVRLHRIALRLSGKQELFQTTSAGI